MVLKSVGYSEGGPGPVPIQALCIWLSGIGTVAPMPTHAAFGLKRHPNHERWRQYE